MNIKITNNQVFYSNLDKHSIYRESYAGQLLKKLRTQERTADKMKVKFSCLLTENGTRAQRRGEKGKIWRE
jgi:predicted ATPase